MTKAADNNNLQAAWQTALDSEDRVTELRIQTIVDSLGRAALAAGTEETESETDHESKDTGGQQTPASSR